MLVNNIGGIRTFASQLAFFNEVMLPNKTDIAGDAVIAVLNAVVEGKAVATASAEPAQTEEQSVKGRKRGRTNRTSSTQPGQKETIKDFVVAATELPADILSDKAIVAIFKNKGVADAYSRALRTDGYREEMGNELAGAAMRSGSFGDLLAAGMIMGAMGDKESPTYTKMFSHLISIIRSGETFVDAAGFAKIYYPRNMLIEAADRRMDELTVAKCLVAVFENFPDSSWCIDKTLAIGMKFASAKKEDALAILQPVLEAYSKNRDKNIRIQAVACFNEPSKIEAFLSNVQFEDLGSDKFRVAYLAALARAVALFKAKGSETDGEALLNRLSVRIAEGVTKACEFLRKPDFAFPKQVAPFMESVGKCYPQLWAQIMMRATLPPCSAEFNKVTDTLSSVPNLLSTFLAGYQCEP